MKGVEVISDRRHLSKIMLFVFLMSIVIFAGKLIAFLITKSDSVFSDALESIANILASGFGLFGVYYSGKPKDETHPYGHGKIEYLASGFEGALILFASVTILLKAAHSLFYSKPLEEINTGIYIIFATSLLNFIVGFWLVRTGLKKGSTILHADGKHLISDGVTSIGIIVGLWLVSFTGYKIIDPLMAILLGVFTFYTGFKLLKSAMDNLMDKADYSRLDALSVNLQNIRKDQWIDIHNLRILNYGNAAHIDCHMTLPLFFTVDQSSKEVAIIEAELKKIWKNELELFIHVDPCVPGEMCKHCRFKACIVRKNEFNDQKKWNTKTLLEGDWQE